MDRKLRQAMLKPLVRRRPNMADNNSLISAYKRIDDLAVGGEILKQLRDVIDTLGKKKKPGSHSDPDSASKQVALAKALYLSRRITKQEFIFFATYPVENVFHGRMAEGVFDSELKHISDTMKEIERAHGLGPDEYWKINDAPLEFKKLDNEWQLVADSLFLETLKEFGLHDLADLMEKQPEEFDRLRERGRRASAHKNEIELVVRDIVVRLEEDARRAAKVKAYSAAVVSLGAGLEGLLLLRCLRSKHKAIRISKKLQRRLRPRYPEDLTTWTFNNLIQVCLEAGWLSPVSTSYANYNSAGLADLLRGMRNNIHPGRFAKDKPWSEIDERDFKDAYSIYVIMLSKLAGIGQRKLKSLASL